MLRLLSVSLLLGLGLAEEGEKDKVCSLPRPRQMWM